jgi:hypothetical protein
VSRDVKFGEDIASRKSHEPILVTEDEELELEQYNFQVKEEETITPSNSIKRP